MRAPSTSDVRGAFVMLLCESLTAALGGRSVSIYGWGDRGLGRERTYPVSPGGRGEELGFEAQGKELSQRGVREDSQGGGPLLGLGVCVPGILWM